MKMKKQFLLVFVAIMFACMPQVMAQKDSSGIYSTAKDFEQGSLSYAINCNSINESIKIDLIHVSKEHYIKVEHNDSKGYHFFRLKASDVYGYKTCDSEVYRILENRIYHMLNPQQSILIYTYVPPELSLKNISLGEKYYFSVGASNVMQSLTIAHLKATFPDNHKFHKQLDAQFKRDKEICGFDNDQKKFMINKLLEESQLK
jgi:hypothetical protein